MSEQPPPPSPLPPPPPPPSDTHLNGNTSAPPDTVAPKRHRRPSVRLGDIGDQHTYDNTRRTKQNQWKFASKESKSSKTRPLVNLTGGFQDFGQDDSKDCRDDINNNNINIINGGSSGNGGGNDNINGVIGSWKGRDCSKSKRGFSGSKRVRTNWGEEFGQDDDESLNFEMDDEMELNYRGKEARVRVSDGIELDGPSDNNNNNNNNCLERDGVRVWLNQLGLGRYAPVFEVHEVDDEVLPLLTLEDLKDMGINAVGSRRKMFCSIQKLGKGFS